jgi:uncharacterized membrane protein YphA (DoxX/SURF4 family)
MAASSHFQGSTENAFSLDSQQWPGIGWSTAHRFAFRLVFSFLVLAVFPFPFNSFGGSVYQIGFYERMWFAVASWLSKHVLHLPPTPSVAAPFLLVDNTNGYVELLCFVVLAALAAIVWTLLDRKRPDYRTLHEWLRIYVRYALGFTMLGYGMDKVFALQFNSSLPGPDRLAEPLGNYSPFALMWTFMGYSKPYTIFAGAGEVIGGVLLLFRRTTTLGAIIICGVMANVVALDFSYGVALKILVSFYLLLAIFLLVPDFPRLVNVFVLNRPAPAAVLANPIPDDWLRRSRPILHLALVVFALYFFAGPGLQGPRERGNRPKSPFYGLYQVEAFTRNGTPVTQNDASWRRVIFEAKGDMTVLTMDDSMHYYGADANAANNTVTISGEYREIRSRSPANADSDSVRRIPNSVLTYSWPDADHLEFRGDLAGEAIVVEMRKVDISKFTLVSRGFHWVENPFYR